MPKLSLPVAGAIVWAVVGAAALFLPERTATFVLLFGTGAIFPLALALARPLGERVLNNTSPLAKLMAVSVLMVNLLWALHLTLLLDAPEYMPLTISIGLGLHWVVVSWVVGHRVGLVHAIGRTMLVTSAWWFLPDWRITAVAAAVVVAYGYSIVELSRRQRSTRLR